ncbi:hypothetical protein [Arthrobacter sp. UYEF36]|uniref:hypothetical protein n=1 Tax=Arthrobacter sp. UYEF36 TaxID=1756366 RepID=UPI00339B361E
MGCFPPLLRRPAGGSRHVRAARLAAAVAALALTASCSAWAPGTPAPTPSTAPPAAPVTAVINQLRDNYSQQIIAVQLTNTTDSPVTVLGAVVVTPLFSGTIEWQPAPGGIELPPGQTKILPARLHAPECGVRAAPPDAGAAVELLLAGDSDAAPLTTLPATTVPATDPYGVLDRNNTEMCLVQSAAAVAGIRLEPDLEVSADARSAVLTLAITPRSAPGGANPGSTGSLTINRIDGTTLVQEDAGAPWPRSVSVQAGGASQRFRLGIRPARCDPHAIADDKLGTLLPLRVTAGGRDGVLKIDAGAQLRGRIYGFITTACGRQ